MKNCPECGRSVMNDDTKCKYCNAILNNIMECPECKSKNVSSNIKLKKEVSCFWIALAILFLPIIILPMIFIYLWKRRDTRIEYICNDCGNKFKLS